MISLGVLQLADFGISRLSHTGTRCGCPAKSNQDLGALEVESFDIWSLGCVLLDFICCSGWFSEVLTQRIIQSMESDSMFQALSTNLGQLYRGVQEQSVV